MIHHNHIGSSLEGNDIIEPISLEVHKKKNTARRKLINGPYLCASSSMAGANFGKQKNSSSLPQGKS